ncbi:sprT domain-containing protein [Salmonella bongori]|jgi:predicted SprT family Zn-dependent metalloprotease|uniref:SprT domain-containing protein n=1 Tax=Salmonella muenchen TaxID=596 RepID=A0A5W3IRM4_SALMU|nr:sprT domain-containing protein [Salmonella enterica subsp. enterica serovar Monschaui]EBW6611842.1 sprT domain-containing protein [Salmonella enterica subsp. enterica serovar Muenchen]ECB6235014.1 sprT domain-containing protein [Salmonella enterica subsp. enterica serovar Minnesota]ECC9598932.1 sprT domain-containing protein [Salmonella bongori]EIM5291234.1 SprT-like domain-containing protein [Salmonella enterica subsp. enterica serovar Ealing]
MLNPTADTYNELQIAFEHFNKELFNGEIPYCLITLQREKKTYGYFSSKRFVHRTEKTSTDEIALNPSYFAVIPEIEIMQTLVHEMAHAWQFHYGKPGRRGYHNKEWADKMEAIGLMPSNTGQPGGKRTGEKMADYPIEGGPFVASYERLLEKDNFNISWLDRFPVRHAAMQALGSANDGDLSSFESLGVELGSAEQKKPTRFKYTCGCGINIWGKGELDVNCNLCNTKFEVRE